MNRSRSRKTRRVNTRHAGLIFVTIAGFSLVLTLMVFLMGDGRSLHLIAFAVLISLFYLWWGLSILFLEDFLAKRGYTVSLSVAMKDTQFAWRSPVFPPQLSRSKQASGKVPLGHVETTHQLWEVIQKEKSRSSNSCSL